MRPSAGVTEHLSAACPRMETWENPEPFGGFGDTINPDFISVAQSHSEAQSSASAVQSCSVAVTAEYDFSGSLLTYGGHFKHGFKCPP